MNTAIIKMIMAGVAFSVSAAAHADTQPLLTEGFETGALPSGWKVYNFSDNPVSAGWFQAASTPDTFAAQSGSADSFFASNVFIGAQDAGGNPYGRVDAMLLTPTLSLEAGTTLSFWTRTVAGSSFADSLRVGAFVAGSYKSLLTINPGMKVGSYPDGWTHYQVSLPGQGAGVTGRYFFEYNVPNAGQAGNFVGLDSVQVSLSPVPEPTSASLALAGLCGLVMLRVRRKALCGASGPCLG